MLRLPAQGPAPRGETTSRARAAVLSITGSIVAIGIAAVGLLVVPIAALVVFGPALFDLLR
ncbi:MAG: hypothetical protein EOO67_01535 [Microbacterium sp.]|nr:MAG: hypothetical protein EOO67_01535 [Microbacterium sp.]